MKKLLIILFLGVLASITASAQSITNVTVIPFNPTADDSITVITESSFNTDAYSVVNQVYIDTTTKIINIQLFKCKMNGPPAIVLTDTFRLGQLSIASWSLNILLFNAQYNPSTSTCGTFSMADTDNSTIVVSQPGPVTGISPYSSHIAHLFPNPAQNTLRIAGLLPGSSARLRIANLQGQAVMVRQLEDSSGMIDIHHLSQGLYLYTLEAGGNTVTGKLVITRE